MAAVGFVGYHAAVFFPTWADESVHAYVASRVAQGAVLYRDVHSARPPLALMPLAALMAAKLPALLASRLAVIAAGLAIALCLAAAGTKLFGSAEGFAAAGLFLLAPETAARFAFTGIHFVALGSTGCAALALLDAPALAGLAGGLALGAGQHAAVIVGASGLWILHRSRRGAAAFGLSALATLALIYGGAAALGGQEMARDLVGRHLYHLGASSPADDGELRWFLPTTALENLVLVALAATALARRPAPAASGCSSAFAIRAALAALIGAHVAAVALMKGGLVLYLFPALPLIALLAGDGAVRVARAVRSGPSRALGAAIALAIAASSAAGLWASRERYQQRDAHPYPALPHARHIAMARLQKLAIVEAIARVVEAESSPEETVFGFPTLVAQIALAANRRVAGELADLAPRWIQLGTVTRQSVVGAIEADRIRFFITPRWFYFKDPYFKTYLSRCYDPPRVFPRPQGDGGGIPDVLVYRRREDACR
jgi:hypothetical protein